MKRRVHWWFAGDLLRSFPTDPTLFLFFSHGRRWQVSPFFPLSSSHFFLAGFFKGTSADQDRRFSDKELKLLKSIKFPPQFDTKAFPFSFSSTPRRTTFLL